MTKRFIADGGMVRDIEGKIPTIVTHDKEQLNEFLTGLNELYEENMTLRSKHTQLIILLKDIINDLKRIDTKGYAEHIEKIGNIDFLSRGLNND